MDLSSVEDIETALENLDFRDPALLRALDDRKQVLQTKTQQEKAKL